MSVNQVCGDAPRPRRAPEGLGSCGGCRWHLPSHPYINRSRLYRHYRFTEQQLKQRTQRFYYIFQNQQQKLRERKRQTKHGRNRPEKRLDNVEYISARNNDVTQLREGVRNTTECLYHYRKIALYIGREI